MDQPRGTLTSAARISTTIVDQARDEYRHTRATHKKPRKRLDGGALLGLPLRLNEPR
jgi:hypothetical protein